MDPKLLISLIKFIFVQLNSIFMEVRQTIFILFSCSLFIACNSGKTKSPFCNNDCLKDSLKFIKEEDPLKPYVYISASNCQADTITWSYSGMGSNRKLPLGYPLTRDHVRCYIKDTSYAWVIFNTCPDAKGYFFKLPFNKKNSIRRSNAAINNFDPKFSVAEGLVANTDRGNIFVEDMITGQTAMMTFGKKTDMDLDAIHETIDSVNITRTRIWAKVKLDGEWKPIEKTITLQ
jgi:hypothetical protein